MGTPLGPKYIPYTYMDPLGDLHCPAGTEVPDVTFGFGHACQTSHDPKGPSSQ